LKTHELALSKQYKIKPIYSDLLVIEERVLKLNDEIDLLAVKIKTKDDKYAWLNKEVLTLFEKIV
jgi:hypothetical protein